MEHRPARDLDRPTAIDDAHGMTGNPTMQITTPRTDLDAAIENGTQSADSNAIETMIGNEPEPAIDLVPTVEESTPSDLAAALPEAENDAAAAAETSVAPEPESVTE